MHCDYLIIGQGIAGTLLSYELIRSGKTVVVLDDPKPVKASLNAGGLLNPFSARDWSRMKSQEKYLPVALETYRQLEQFLDTPLLTPLDLLVFPEHEEGREAITAAATRMPEALQVYDLNAQQHWDPYFHIPCGMGRLQPLYHVDTIGLIRQWRQYLDQHHALRETRFDSKDLIVDATGIRYEDISAGKLVFCEGSAGQFNPMFPGLPFTRNRGEALLLSVPGLPATHVYHHQIRLVPRRDGLFWCGSNYSWDFNDLEPDIAWRDASRKKLEDWLKIPFTITDHLVAERPTTAGQQVISVRHPQYPDVFLFNGLGTRGFSSGPWHVRHFCAGLRD